MATVDVVHWNPERRVSRYLPARVTRPVDNFGDLIGPWVVQQILRRHGIDAATAPAPARLVAVGSILHFAQTGDVIWGAGVNGKSMALENGTDRLDVRAVRGPRTAEFLASLGYTVPGVFGDPGALVGQLWAAPVPAPEARKRAITIIPNLNDLHRFPKHPGVVDPRTKLSKIVKIIANSRFVTGSSLHGVVVAESFGIPARLIASPSEPSLKYDDYYRGTGRPGYRAAADVEEAVRLGGEPPARLDPALLEAFPLDLWTPRAVGAER